jgi:hypothetical protein
VLIAAAPDYDLVIVCPLSALDEMISHYHPAETEAETRRPCSARPGALADRGRNSVLASAHLAW